MQASGGGAPADEMVDDITERIFSIRLLIVDEEVMTGTMAIEDKSHALGVADKLERTEDWAVGSFGLILRTLGPFNVFILLSGWICLHGVLD